MNWGYIIYSESRDRYYVGSTGVGVEVRVERHNEGWTSTTKLRVPWELKFMMSFAARNEALNWEKYAKAQKSRMFTEWLLSTQENELK